MRIGGNGQQKSAYKSGLDGHVQFLVSVLVFGRIKVSTDMCRQPFQRAPRVGLLASRAGALAPSAPGRLGYNWRQAVERSGRYEFSRM